MIMTSLLSRVLALVLLVALFPVLLALWIACLIVQGRPVLFLQYRSGKGAVPFRLIKFRTMSDARDETGALLADQQRVTPIGAFLRRSRLDEILGLINVMQGDMALVGPRPLLPATIEQLGSRGRKRCAVKPGLTGWAQVNGNTLLTLNQKVTLDLWYIENRSTLLDLKILALTLLVVVGGEKVRTGTA